MESQNALELEWWSNHEIIPNEDEVYSFQYQLPPLDLSPCDLMLVQQDHFLDDHASYNMMDSKLPNPVFSSIDDVLSGLHDQKMSTMNELRFPNQEMHSTNELGFPNEEVHEINSSGFPNQERYSTNSLEFSYQLQPAVIDANDNNEKIYSKQSLEFAYQTQPAVIDVNDNNEEMYSKNSLEFSYQTPPSVINVSDNNEEMSMVKFGFCEQKKEVERKSDNGDGNHSGRSITYESRMILSREVIAQYFYMPITQAAKELNVGLTLLKKRCRELGIRRWPHRKLMSIQTLINNVQEGRTNANGAEEKIEEVIGRLEEEKRKLEEIPDLKLKDNTKRLRQACFKANYKKRKTMGLATSVANSSASIVTTQLASSCSSNRAGYEVTEEGYDGDYDEQEEIKSILYTDSLPSSNNGLF